MIGVLPHAVHLVLQMLGASVSMFWETLWPLIVGFWLSGVVQAFVGREAMQRRLGDHRPAAVARGAVFGMASSSCSYAAAAMSRSLILKGADVVSALVFLTASTNLVVELGVVLVVLMGWEFAAAQLFGGVVMVIVVTVLGGLFWRGKTLVGGEVASTPSSEHGAEVFEGDGAPRGRWRARLGDKAAWADAATFTVGDLTMVRRELLIGYGVAGVLVVAVPDHLWGALFLHGHGVWTTLENVVVGPLLAVVSFVCSIGNVPLAAALWSGGISFGGVLAFLFSDLITFPLILIYRRYYGGKMAMRIVVVLFAAAVLAALVTEATFWALGIVPPRHHLTTTSAGIHWDLTTYLNLIALGLAGLVLWLYHHREAWGAGEGYGRDPVCSMVVRIADAPARANHRGRTYVFCSPGCHDRFAADPERYRVELHAPQSAAPTEGQERVVDPICSMEVTPGEHTPSVDRAGVRFYFCSTGCAERFAAGAPTEAT